MGQCLSGSTGTEAARLSPTATAEQTAQPASRINRFFTQIGFIASLGCDTAASVNPKTGPSPEFTNLHIWQHILPLLSQSDVRNVRVASKRLNQVVDNESTLLLLFTGDAVGDNHLRHLLKTTTLTHKRLAAGERKVHRLILAFNSSDRVRQKLSKYLGNVLPKILVLAGLAHVQYVEFCYIAEIGRMRLKFCDLDLIWRAWRELALPAVLLYCRKLHAIVNATKSSHVRPWDFTEAMLKAYLAADLPGLASLQDLSLKVASGADLPPAMTALTALHRLTLTTGRSPPNTAVLNSASFPALACLSLDFRCPAQCPWQLPSRLVALHCSHVEGLAYDLRTLSYLEVLALHHLPLTPEGRPAVPPRLKMLSLITVQACEIKALGEAAPSLKVLKVGVLPEQLTQTLTEVTCGKPLLSQLTHLHFSSIGELGWGPQEDFIKVAFPALRSLQVAGLTRSSSWDGGRGSSSSGRSLPGPHTLECLELTADCNSLPTIVGMVSSLPALTHLCIHRSCGHDSSSPEPPPPRNSAPHITHITLHVPTTSAREMQHFMAALPAVHALRWQHTPLRKLQLVGLLVSQLTQLVLEGVALQTCDAVMLRLNLRRLQAIACVNCTNLCGPGPKPRLPPLLPTAPVSPPAAPPHPDTLHANPILRSQPPPNLPSTSTSTGLQNNSDAGRKRQVELMCDKNSGWRQCYGVYCRACAAALHAAFADLPASKVVWTGAPMLEFSSDAFQVFSSPVWRGLAKHPHASQEWWRIWEDATWRHG